MRNEGVTALIAEFERNISTITDHLRQSFDGSGKTQAINAWKYGMQRLIESYNEQSALLGKAKRLGYVRALDGMEKGRVYIDVLAQFKYLDGMIAELASAPKWRNGFASRAARYAQAVQISYFEALAGHIGDLLPVHPGERSDCAMHCKCHWDIVRLPGRGNYDCRWVVQHDVESCKQCLARGEEWNPLEVRGWRVITQITGAVVN